MIYSTSMYFNDPDLLDLKISEESGHVDKIIIVESEITHSGLFKGLKAPMAKYKDNPKVVYMTIDERTHRQCGSPWAREQLQRDFPRRQYALRDDDIFIVADMDEIIQEEEIEGLLKKAAEHGYVKPSMFGYYYYINVLRGRWTGPFVANGKVCKWYDFNQLYNKSTAYPAVFANIRGRHFSYLYDPEGIAWKIKSAAHTEYNRREFAEPENIKKRISGLFDLFDRRDAAGNILRFRVVEVDETYPKTILNNIGYWKKYIKQ